MKIQYLGTAAAEGWPAVFCGCEACKKAMQLGGKNIRTRSQALIDNKILIDLCPDTYIHMLNYNVPLNAINTLLVTHSHQDHFYPLELAMRGWPYAHEQSAPCLYVYGNDSVKKEFKNAAEHNDSPNFKDVVMFKEIEAFVPFDTLDGYQVTPLLANHSKDEKCFLYLVEKNGKVLFYGNDSGMYPEKTWQVLAGKKLDIVSFDCTNVASADGKYHMGLPDNRKAKQKMLELGCANEETKFVVTHFSHNGKLMHDEIIEETKNDGFIVAYDGIILEV